jgi:hypothetical protein
VNVIRLAIAAGVCIGALGLIGYIHLFVTDVPPRLHNISLLDLDGEYNIPAAFSALLLLVASGLSLLLYETDHDTDWAAIGLCVLFAYMGIDEGTEIHERLDELTGVNWQLLYVPLVVGGAICWLSVVRHLWDRAREPALILVGGAAAWIVAQMFEGMQRGENHVLLHKWMIIPEELLEMCGSALFGLGLLLAVRRNLRAKPQ